MSKHKSGDYKVSAVKYYLANNSSYIKTREIFKYSERSLKRQIERYNELGNIERQNRVHESYKITNKHIKYTLKN